MANVTNSDPMILTQAANPIDLSRQMILIKNVEWVNPLTIGDRVTLTDARGYVICDFVCALAHMNLCKELGDQGTPFNSPLNLSKLDSGYLMIGRM